MNSCSDQDMMKIHVEALFTCDAAGRLHDVREPGEPYPSPRFYMGRTRQGNVWHVRYDLPQNLIEELEDLCRSEPVAVDLRHPPQSSAAIRAVLRTHAPIVVEERGPAYWIPDRGQAHSDVVQITKTNAQLLRDAGFQLKFEQLVRDIDVGPITAIFVQGRIVSICYCARLSTVAAEAGVQTLEEMRGRGYASAAVAGWAAAIRERGLVPLYSTSWANLASQGVARKLGMVCYGEDWSIE